MTRAKLLATSILATTALLSATVATEAASLVPQPGPRQIAVELGAQGAATPWAQAGELPAEPILMAHNDGGDDRDGVEDDTSDDGVEDDDSDDRGQTGETEGGQAGENEGEHED